MSRTGLYICCLLAPTELAVLEQPTWNLRVQMRGSLSIATNVEQNSPQNRWSKALQRSAKGARKQISAVTSHFALVKPAGASDHAEKPMTVTN
eukprot:6172546-Pleurochrysis_carterae.AAC.1